MPQKMKKENDKVRYRWLEKAFCLCLIFLCIATVWKLTELHDATSVFINNWNQTFQIAAQELQTLTSDTEGENSELAKDISSSTDTAIQLFNAENITEYLTRDAHTISYTGNQLIQNIIDEYKKLHAAAIQKQMQTRAGMIGRLEIPSIGVDVALFSSSSQSVVDAADSAAYFTLGNCTIVADHSNQGFDAIKSISVGATAYIDTGESETKLTCTEICQGTNTGHDLLDSNGISISTRSGYAFYTCNDNWQDVTIVFFS